MKKFIFLASLLALSFSLFASMTIEPKKNTVPTKPIIVDLEKLIEMTKPKLRTETNCYLSECVRDEEKAHRVDYLQKKVSTIGPVTSESYGQFVPGTDGMYEYCYIIRWNE